MQTMKIYVAGSSRNRERARRFMDTVRTVHAPGVKLEIAHDWVAEQDANEALSLWDCDLSETERARHATADFDAIETCDAFVLLAEPEATGRGMWVELGFALALTRYAKREPLIFVSGGERRSIFTSERLVTLEVPRRIDVNACDGETFERMLPALAELASYREQPARPSAHSEPAHRAPFIERARLALALAVAVMRGKR